MFAPKELDLNVAVESANINSSQLNVKWTDGHNSIYSSESLQTLRYVIHCVLHSYIIIILNLISSGLRSCSKLCKV
jgi:hypothetical protein